MSGSSRQGEVEVATVTFNVAPGVVALGQDSTFDGVVVATFDGAVLSYKPSLVGTVTLANGVTLKGVRQMAEDGTTLDASLLGAMQSPLLVLHAEDGGSFTVVHDSVDVVETSERITTAYGVDTVVGADPFQFFCIVANGQRTWRAPSWSGFFASDTSRWVSVPTTTNAAVNELAVRAPLVDAGTTEIANGVPATVWSRTIADGTTRSGKVTIHGAFDLAGTTHDSYIMAEFRARRTTGNPPTVVTISATEEGSAGLGSVAVAVNGNDVQIQATYSADFTLVWTLVDETRPVVLP